MVNSIHSSSLAYIPAGPTRPEQESFAKKNPQPPASDNLTSPDAQRNLLPASTPEQIQKALAQSGFDNEGGLSQNQNPRAQKALQSYVDNRNQAMQVQLESVISRVDYYA